jgi:hypothetical protein
LVPVQATGSLSRWCVNVPVSDAGRLIVML